MKEQRLKEHILNDIKKILSKDKSFDNCKIKIELKKKKDSK